MSLIGQSWEFMNGLATRTPWGRINLPALIDDISTVASEFVRFLENGGRVMVAQDPILNFDTAPFILDGWEVRESDQIKSRVKGIDLLPNNLMPAKRHIRLQAIFENFEIALLFLQFSQTAFARI